MVPTLLYLLYKKLRKQNWAEVKTQITVKLFTRSNQLIASLLLLLLLISAALIAQKQTRNYKVVRNGSEIGWAAVEKETDSNRITTIRMGSEVRVRFIFTYESAAREISEFSEGKLRHSYFYRKINGNVKADRHTNLVDNNYEVQDKDKTKLKLSPITYNTLCMYFQEPANISKVYSDNHQCFLDIERQTDGGYRIVSPDDTSNTFYYSSGVCYKIKIKHSFYSAELLLK